MCDDDTPGGLEVYTLCVMMIILGLGGLHIVCDGDKFGSLEVYTFCVIMIPLEVYKFTCCV